MSIPTNIAEGCGRNSDKDFNQFLNIALGSASETEYLILLAKDLKYIDDSNYEILTQEINLIKSKIYTLKNKLNLQ
jgi:S23 ribosomal protein.